MYPTMLKLVLFKKNIVNFLLNFFYSYKKENLDLQKKIKILSEYKGQGCFLMLHNFFLLGIILDVLLLYKNDGLFLGVGDKLYCNFRFLTKVNLWNYFYLKFLLETKNL